MTSAGTLRIVAATESDVLLILEFIRELAAYERHLDRFEATEARIRETLFGAQPVASVIFAFNEDKPVGFAVFILPIPHLRAYLGFTSKICLLSQKRAVRA